MVNSLTREAGARIAPLLLETLVKHYFERLVRDSGTTKLRKDELLYDEAFNIVKTFLEASTKHPVEELQKFSNTRTPSPPWVRVVRLVVPMSCCDAAAGVLIKVLGGEQMTKRTIGGTKWWQVRGVKGVDAEWIAAKKDWQESEKKYKAHEKERSSLNEQRNESTSGDASQASTCENLASYDPSMDEMRCILYAHGGGYYFGSIDQERYAIQRLARKINGRVFAINYRLAPQYPFPCAIQDLVAAYLFLIRPPEGAAHCPVKPEHIVVAGDSAGGGLCIALLQVLRDAGEPLPAGGVLISPWSDMTHSFPSIHTNTATDVLPPYGLSFYKPSTLWPPPPDEITVTVRETLRTRIRQAVTLTTHRHSSTERPHRHSRSLSNCRSRCRSRSRSLSRARSRASTSQTRTQDGSRPVSPTDLRLPQTGQTLHLGSTASLPTIEAGVRDQTVHCKTQDGETLSISQQIHLYTPNYMLAHPLVSPVVSYLGGLPPLLVIAGNGEVLRDEVIYFAHRAAHPDKYPVKQEARDMYPALNGIEERNLPPTKVHLQVYDDAAHVLPILFSFTTPAKYCFRAIALFIRQVTGMLPPSPSQSAEAVQIDMPMTTSPPGTPAEYVDPVPTPSVNLDGASVHSTSPPGTERASRPPDASPPHSSPQSRQTSPRPQSRRGSIFRRGRRKRGEEEPPLPSPPPSRLSFRRTLSAHASKAGSSIFRGRAPTEPLPAGAQSPPSSLRNIPLGISVDVGGPRFGGSGMHQETGVRKAGEASVYQDGLSTMIRERISTHGVVRPLEPESELAAFSLPHELVGQVSELAMRRYHDAKAKFDKKFHGTYKTIEKHRRKHIVRAQKHALRNMEQLQQAIATAQEKGDGSRRPGPAEVLCGAGAKDGLVVSGSYSWAWALDADERPPPSSIVARRDTHEAVELARIADQAVLADENMLSGNNLWSLMVSFLTVVPDKEKKGHERRPSEQSDSRESKRERIRSRFAQLVSDGKKRPRPPPPQDDTPAQQKETVDTANQV